MINSQYGGPFEILVTQGDTIYITEAEKICSRHEVDQNTQKLLTETQKIVYSCIDVGSAEDCGDYGMPEIKETAQDSCSDDDDDDEPLQIAPHPQHLQQPSPSISSPSSPPAVKIPRTSADSAAAGAPPAFFDPLVHPPPSAVSAWAHGLVVIIPLRLGIHSVNAEYIEEIKEVLRMPQCIGILGGRPNHAIYFAGYRGNKLMGFDPHTVFCNPAKPPPPPVNATAAPSSSSSNGRKAPVSSSCSRFPTQEHMSQIHVRELVALDFSQLDPSLAIGLHFHAREEFLEFCEKTRKAVDIKLRTGKTPLFGVQHSPPSFMLDDELMGGGGEDSLDPSTYSQRESFSSPSHRSSSTKDKLRNGTSSSNAAVRGGDAMHFDEEVEIEDEYVFL